MKNLLLLLAAATICFSGKAQYCLPGNRFSETPVFSTVTPSQIKVDSNVKFASKVRDWMGNLVNLKLDITYPRLNIDPLPRRPMVLLIFGGGFTGGNRRSMKKYCDEFAQRGYVAVTIDYRLGQDETTPCTDPVTGAADPLSHEKAIYRAVQDARSALRFLVHNSAAYRIDTNWIFAGGYSAGAVIANAVVYNSAAEFAANYPTIVNALGGIDSSGNKFTNSFSIKGIFNNWGGVGSNFYDDAEAVPTVAFHGHLDNVVPADSALENATCSMQNYYIYGSEWLYRRFTSRPVPICADVTINPSGGHGVYQNGVGLMSRIGRASCFFKSLFCNSCTTYSALALANADCSPHMADDSTANRQMNFAGPENIAATATALDRLVPYPNPFINKIGINNLTGGENFELNNLLGETLYSGNNIVAEDFSGLAAGTYVLKISCQGATRVFKIAKW